VVRVLFLGDMAPTGFGTVTQDLGRQLLALGLDVRFVSQNEWTTLPEPFLSRTFQVQDPQLLDFEKVAAFGADSLSLTNRGIVGLLDGTLWHDGWTPQAAILLGDYTAAKMMVEIDPSVSEAFRSLPTLHYVPIEGVDLPPSWRGLWQTVHPVAMSEFGADQIERVTGKRPPVVYHGIDADAFRPLTPERMLRLTARKREWKIRDKASARKFLGVPIDARIVFRADRLMPRKRYGSLLRAMAPVLAVRPDAYLVVHCAVRDQGGNLDDLRSKYPPTIRDRIVATRIVDIYGSAPRDLLVVLYNMADVYASVSAEGFGLTIAEAMACGVPAVGMAYSAVPEVIGPGGLTAPVDHLVDNEYDHAWAAVNERAFGEQVARLLDDEPLRRQLGRAAREHVRSSFSWTEAAIRFSAIIRDLVDGRS